MKHFIATVLICAIAASTGYAQLKFKVVDDAKAGVRSSIVKVDGKGGRQDLGPTNNDGEFTIAAPCAPGDRLQAIPLIRNTYLPSNETYCVEISGELKVYRIDYANTLKANAIDQELKGKYSTAAYIYNELSSRYIGNDSLEASLYKLKAYNLTAKYLNVKDAFEIPKDSDSTMILTYNFTKSLMKVQQKNGLPADGILTITTSQKLAKLSTGDVNTFSSTPPVVPATKIINHLFR